MGWTTDLLEGCAEHLAAASVGLWLPNGVYGPDDIGIVIRDVPQTPNRLITLANYPVGTDLPGMADHISAIQIRIRAGRDPRECDDLADDVFDALDSAMGLRWRGIPIKQIWRQSYTSLGKDGNGRWERSENYYIDSMRPTAHRTD
ncbi:minor capsid protein [Polymorphospora rubra]|uniref:Tail terminator n=1 Tax=Polymorphospora rubra TaxID=338584 RepID=A0A810MUF8_9ACTN|nr:minor capsid protein [Polymorphospora rubra]BCJ64150.1 hypothetical protein Prubr_11710 [Polymorphospora rubra]